MTERNQERRRIFRVWLIPVILLVTACLAGAYLLWYREPGPRSVLFILVDTVRRDHVSCYGYERKTTPNIDELASQGIQFENAIAQSSWTLPSMISLMSGKYLFSKIPKLPDETLSLAQFMKRRGYRTAAFIANSLVGEKEGFSKGFDHFEIRKQKTSQWSGADLNERLLPWMRSELEPPFFLYLHYLDPHFPYEPPVEFARFEGGHDPVHFEKRSRFADFVLEHPELRDGAEKDIDKMRRLIDGYDGEIRFMDHCIGQVLDEVAQLGLDEETVVVLTADHGECLWDRRHYPKAVEKRYPEEKDRNLTTYFFRDHGYHLFNELIRVPLIIKGPGIQQGLCVDAMVENVDLAPTLAALSGDPEGFKGDGRNLLPALTDPNVELSQKMIILSHCNEGTCAFQPSYNVKLIAPSKTGQYFGLDYLLFDLSKDPLENENRLGKEYADPANFLLKAIEEREAHDYFKDKSGDMDEDTKAKMKELGYAAGG